MASNLPRVNIQVEQHPNPNPVNMEEQSEEKNEEPDEPDLPSPSAEELRAIRLAVLERQRTEQLIREVVVANDPPIPPEPAIVGIIRADDSRGDIFANPIQDNPMNNNNQPPIEHNPVVDDGERRPAYRSRGIRRAIAAPRAGPAPTVRIVPPPAPEVPPPRREPARPDDPPEDRARIEIEEGPVVPERDFWPILIGAPLGSPPPGTYTTTVQMPGWSRWIRQVWDYGSRDLNTPSAYDRITDTIREGLTEWDSVFYKLFDAKSSMFWAYRKISTYGTTFPGDRRPVNLRRIPIRCQNPIYDLYEVVTATGKLSSRGSSTVLRNLRYKRMIVAQEAVAALSSQIRLNNPASSTDNDWLKSIENSTTCNSINLTDIEAKNAKEWFMIMAFRHLGISLVNQLTNSNPQAN